LTATSNGCAKHEGPQRQRGRKGLAGTLHRELNNQEDSSKPFRTEITTLQQQREKTGAVDSMLQGLSMDETI